MILSQQATNPFVRVFRNTDQKIDLLVRTIDRRPVLLDNLDHILFRVFDRDNKTVLEATAQLEDYDKGHYAVYLTKEQTAAFYLGNYTYVLLLVGNGLERLLYSDKDYGANAPLKVIEGQYPPQAEAITINPMSLMGGATSALIGAAQLANPAGSHALMINLATYTGTVSIQATLEDDIPLVPSEWTEVVLKPYLLVSGPQIIGFVGNYKWVRVVFSETTGLMSISYRNV